MRTRAGPGTASRGSLFPRIYDVVRRIPSGKVATYGQIAAIVGTCTPKLVGYALASIPDGLDVPWQRVINSQGRISFHGGGFFSDLQRKMLIAEGICFSREGKVNLQRYGWRP